MLASSAGAVRNSIAFEPFYVRWPTLSHMRPARRSGRKTSREACLKSWRECTSSTVMDHSVAGRAHLRNGRSHLAPTRATGPSPTVDVLLDKAPRDTHHRRRVLSTPGHRPHREPPPIRRARAVEPLSSDQAAGVLGKRAGAVRVRRTRATHPCRTNPKQ